MIVKLQLEQLKFSKLEQNCCKGNSNHVELGATGCLGLWGNIKRSLCDCSHAHHVFIAWSLVFYVHFSWKIKRSQESPHRMLLSCKYACTLWVSKELYFKVYLVKCILSVIFIVTWGKTLVRLVEVFTKRAN